MSEVPNVVGESTGAAVIDIERGPVANFATAVTDGNEVYTSLEAAKAAGFEQIPAPPTFTFAAANWGAFDQVQDDPAQGPMAKVIGALMANGGIVLHGEQEFIFHQPVTVGMKLSKSGKVTDQYEKQSGDKTMTFLVMETEFRDENDDLVVTEIFNLLHRT